MNLLLTRLEELNPHPNIKALKKCQSLFIGLFVLMFIPSVGQLLKLTKNVPPQFGADYVILVVLFSVLAITFLVLWIVSAIIGRSEEKAVGVWFDQDHPDLLTLARLFISSEFTYTYRLGAEAILDRQFPNWRQQAVVLSPRLHVPAELPSLPPESKNTGLYTLLLSPLALVSIGMFGYALFWSPDHRLAWFGGSVLGIVMFFVLISWLVDRPNADLFKKWQSDLISRYSRDELIGLYEVPPSESLKEYMAGVLDKCHPGWSVSPNRPVLSVGCICPPRHE